MCNGQHIPAVCNEERHAAKDYKKSALRRALLDPTDAGDLEWAAAQSALMQIESLLYHANAHRNLRHYMMILWESEGQGCI